jgi:hypothetical protein
MILLEVGKKYLSRDGRFVGEVLEKVDNGVFEFKVELRYRPDGGFSGYFDYTKDGLYYSNIEFALDLVEEIR